MESSADSSKIPSLVSLTAAAIVGASFMAISAYWMHQRSMERLLERGLERRKLGKEDKVRRSQCRRSKTVVEAKSYEILAVETGIVANGLTNHSDSKLVSSTSPSVSDHDEKIEKAAFDHSACAIPPGLPKVKTKREGSCQSLHSARRATPLGNSVMRSSPTASNGAFGSMEESDNESDLGEDEVAVDGVTPELSSPRDNAVEPPAGAVVSDTSEQQKAMNRSISIPGEMHHAPDPVAADILRKEPEQETFVRLNVAPIDAPSDEEEEVCLMMQECLEMRDKYVFREMVPPWKKGIFDSSTPKANPDPFRYEPQAPSKHVYRMENGVVHVYTDADAKEELFPVADATTFFTDMHRILRIVSLGNVRTLCHHRLRLLEQKFSLHLMLNADREFLAQKSAPHRDFYNVRKVDTHVHHSSCMNQKHLLRFIKSKLRKEPDEVVIFRDGKYLTLKEVFESLDLTGYDLNVDLLDVHADKNTFHRFDKFNLKYNPCGQSRLREIFLKQDNLIQGRFLAELTKEVFSDLAGSKYQMAEYRISVYGRKQSEWDQLASWIVNNDLYSENVVWLIQLPRLYNVYYDMGIVTSFQSILDNVFIPLFEVTVNPDSHPQLHVFLKQVVGFDMVDDESKPERRPTKHMQTPEQWQISFNPAYSYWAYYVYANLYTLNKLRESKGMSTIKFRPHAGEAGDVDHLAAAFLLTHNIAHGNNLRKSPGLQYLFYLAQIGLSMSPLSNNSLFLDYHRNPFPMFFARGLNVSLSTDDPLQIHLTKEPLVEEYSIAAQVWKLSSCDICEIARNSVNQSGFDHGVKCHWLGNNCHLRGPAGNDIHKSNVPHMRIEFRHEVWKEELNYVFLGQTKIPNYVDI
ncbi:AMP deaminase [Selaginella moellendorffii]|uniref:AMP deaminase n=1 Tax=Selaginella moellendorffii TaxID=88036 RepID=UPI000D1CA108|nr:AMP deaminase [Selaginella moellendorffii]|eukprot:XP_024528681.1 AMP deaminase [Selaginella moellendorffii]